MMQSWGTARTPIPPGAVASPKRPSNDAFLHYATQPVWARNPDSQPTKVNPPYLEQGNLALFFSIMSQGLQPDFKLLA